MIIGTKSYFVYILASKSRRLYIGVTNDLSRRMYEHKQKATQGFAAQYNINRLVYFDETGDVLSAIAREKQILRFAQDDKLSQRFGK